MTPNGLDLSFLILRLMIIQRIKACSLSQANKIINLKAQRPTGHFEHGQTCTRVCISTSQETHHYQPGQAVLSSKLCMVSVKIDVSVMQFCCHV